VEGLERRRPPRKTRAFAKRRPCACILVKEGFVWVSSRAISSLCFGSCCCWLTVAVAVAVAEVPILGSGACVLPSTPIFFGGGLTRAGVGGREFLRDGRLVGEVTLCTQ
jgi:hypothetical protein